MSIEKDNALMAHGGPHIRLLLCLKYGPNVHAKCCDNSDFKKDSDDAIDLGVASILALKEIKAVMGPKVPACCEGCEWEWGEALRIIECTLGVKV